MARRLGMFVCRLQDNSTRHWCAARQTSALEDGFSNMLKPESTSPAGFHARSDDQAPAPERSDYASKRSMVPWAVRQVRLSDSLRPTY